MPDTPSTASHHRFARSEHVDSTVAGDRAVIFHREKGAAITLNSTATILWTFLSEPRTREQLEAAVMDRWPSVPPETAARDVEAFLREMLAHGFCSVEPDNKI